ncbi:phosphopantetheine-binding protein [Richelia sinica FACHB-800]|uniref:Phosphopantetheine-binding protein n=1 Tax=Richelia sinica FACHB-800 TaxID=1357546 RepID=A0A975TDR0_9NOST|nr:acyl carrier protein [Richelia sinica]MBD2666035.1 acyl carrier protein [Richelia sinica FACHB-800]QXE26267.1 phosphopantetheine-binding protein [Richelia sinica FACHB-800]
MTHSLSKTPIKQAISSVEIQGWLVSNISYLLGIEADEIDIHEPLDSYGLDSSQAIVLASKAEKFLGIQLSLIHLWYYPTISELSQRLAEDLENSQAEILQL